jgi:hypothetical protein
MARFRPRYVTVPVRSDRKGIMTASLQPDEDDFDDELDDEDEVDDEDEDEDDEDEEEEGYQLAR